MAVHATEAQLNFDRHFSGSASYVPGGPRAIHSPSAIQERLCALAVTHCIPWLNKWRPVPEAFSPPPPRNLPFSVSRWTGSGSLLRAGAGSARNPFTHSPTGCSPMVKSKASWWYPARLSILGCGRRSPLRGSAAARQTRTDRPNLRCSVPGDNREGDH
jgi:hypothetical protein